MASEAILRLQRSWNYYRTSDGLELSSMLRQARFQVEGVEGGGRLEAILAALFAGVPAEDAAAALARRSGLREESVASFLDFLRQQGALIEERPSERDTRGLYSRQIRFFDLFESNEATGTELNRRLQHRTVLIVGMGGMGTWIAALLSRMGVRRIIGIDDDRVELSNVSRQLLYTREDVGRLKVEAAAAALGRVDDELQFTGHAVHIESPADLLPYLDGVDLVFNPFGYSPNRILEHVAVAAGTAGVPCLLLGAGSLVGPLTVPGETACYRCLRSVRPLAEAVNATLETRSVVSGSSEPLPVLVPRIAMVTSLAVWEAVRFLSGIDRAPSLDGLIALDLFSYQQSTFISVPRDPRCPACKAWQARRTGGSPL